ncbi:MAG: lysophospholipid acyltransferase family protein [Betaproteobacteria bacterium]|nr:lysophospholipid acyltransferase family protein [Betaproteobacteria bacterium]
MVILRGLGSWLVVALLWLLHWLPMPVLGGIGRALGRLLYRFGRGRVTDTNLALCFPGVPQEQRKAIGRRHFEALGRSAIELSVMWFGSDERVLGLVTVRGREHLERQQGKPTILLAPHFVGLNMGGGRLAHEFPDSASIYSRQKNPVLDRLFLKGRLRFGNPTLLSRQDGMRAIVKVLREGKCLYFLPDMDFGARDAIFSPFFGVPAATVTALPRLARLGRATVVPVICWQREHGYEVRIYPPWEDYPTDDIEADVRRMNAFIEERVREHPEQYFWAHKRFKTRPPGEPSPYRRK